MSTLNQHVKPNILLNIGKVLTIEYRPLHSPFDQQNDSQKDMKLIKSPEITGPKIYRFPLDNEWSLGIRSSRGLFRKMKNFAMI